MTTDSFNEKEVTVDSMVLDNLVVDENIDLDSQSAEDITKIEEPTLVKEDEIVKSPKKDDEVPSLVPVNDGVIGAGKINKKDEAKPAKVAPKKDSVKTVALFASRNVSWQGLGKLLKGYNFVSAEAADKWLTLDTVRLVSPEEIKTNLG